MAQDRFVEAVDQVADAGREACLAIERAVGALQRGSEARIAGRAVVDVVDDLIAAGGRETRLDATEQFRAFERAVASMRAVVLRALVDENGLSFTDVGRRLKVSRQAAAKLYERATEKDVEGFSESAN